MSIEYNIYCDESCHLPNDNINSMALGAVWCEQSHTKAIFRRIREIKVSHKLSPSFEIKWNKVSKGKEEFYIDLVNYFFDCNDLHFRGVVIPNKGALDHGRFNQTHDDFYYKMYFTLLNTILDPTSTYNVYIDIKDTQSEEKIKQLHQYLCNGQYDFHQRIIRRIQHVRSHEVEILQIADLLTGALAYLHRGLSSNSAKVNVLERIKSRSGYDLRKTTLPREEKMNILIWKPSN